MRQPQQKKWILLSQTLGRNRQSIQIHSNKLKCYSINIFFSAPCTFIYVWIYFADALKFVICSSVFFCLSLFHSLPSIFFLLLTCWFEVWLRSSKIACRDKFSVFFHIFFIKFLQNEKRTTKNKCTNAIFPHFSSEKIFYITLEPIRDPIQYS